MIPFSDSSSNSTKKILFVENIIFEVEQDLTGPIPTYILCLIDNENKEYIAQYFPQTKNFKKGQGLVNIDSNTKLVKFLDSIMKNFNIL